LDPVESALRAALDKGDAADAGFRNRIYASAQAALERSIAARPLSQTEIDNRRRRLASSVALIESEFAPAVPEINPVHPEPSFLPDDGFEPAPEPRLDHQAQVSHVSRAEQRLEPAFSDAPQAALAPGLQKEHGRDRAPLRDMRRPLPWLRWGFNIAFLLALVLGGWWAWSAGKAYYLDATTNKPATQKPQLAEPGKTGEDAERTWITVFAPADTDLLTVPEGASAALGQFDGTDVVTLKTTRDPGEIRLAIGAGVVKTLAGKRALINFRARATNGAEVETGIGCDFGALGKCARKRFKIPGGLAEYMFAIDLKAGSATDGVITITPDMSGGGGAVDIQDVRVSILDPQ
jgi:hypothetical protein